MKLYRRKWPSLAAVTGLLTLVAAVVAAGIAIPEYRLKVKSQRATSDVELARLFAQLVPIANGRGVPFTSEAAIAATLKNNKNVTEAQVERFGTLSSPVGAATQAAAIMSIGYLGKTYDALREPARVALRALSYIDRSKVEQLRNARRDAYRMVMSD